MDQFGLLVLLSVSDWQCSFQFKVIIIYKNVGNTIQCVISGYVHFLHLFTILYTHRKLTGNFTKRSLNTVICVSTLVQVPLGSQVKVQFLDLFSSLSTVHIITLPKKNVVILAYLHLQYLGTSTITFFKTTMTESC